MHYDPNTGLWVDDTTGDSYDDSGNLVMMGSGSSGSSAVSQANQAAQHVAGGGVAGPPNANGQIGGMSNSSDGSTRYPIRTTDLGDRVVTYYSDGTSDVTQKGRLPAQNSSQIHTTERLIDPNQIAVERIRAQNQIDIAKLQNEATNARTETERQNYLAQAAAKQQEMSGLMSNGSPTEAAREFDSKQALDYYTKLANDAANPRNFVQSFFQQRGQVAPAAAQGQGNLAAIQSYLPFLLGSSQGQMDVFGQGLPNGGIQGQGAPGPGGGRATTQIVPDTSPMMGGAGASHLLPQFANPMATGQRDDQGSPIMQQANGEKVSVGAGTTLLSPQQVAIQSALMGRNVGNATLMSNGISTMGREDPTTALAPEAIERNNAAMASGNISPNSSAVLEQAAGGTYNQNTGTFQTGYNGENAPVAKSQEQMHGSSFSTGGKIRPPGRVLPEPIVGKGTMTGDTYTFNEPDPRTGQPRPEGVVPAQYLPKFLQQRHGMTMAPPQGTPPMPQQHGYYFGGDLGSDTSSPAPDPYSPPPPPPSPYSSLQQSSGFASDPGPYNSLQQSSGFASDPGFIGPVNQNPSSSITPPSFNQDQMNQLIQQELNRFSAPNATPDSRIARTLPVLGDTAPNNTVPSAGGGGTAHILPVIGDTAPNNTVPVASGGGPFTGAAPAVSAPAVSVGGGGGSPAFVQQPTAQPQASNNFNAGASSIGTGITPAQVSPAGTFGSTSGNLPQFLPGEDSSTNSVLAALQASNAVPPFLTRIFGQANGDQSQGTNQPNPMKLPSGVPLVSQLSYNQMTPSEQQALMSYVSASGMTPEDYLALIKAYSPQGAPASQPLFGNHFATERQ